MAPRRAQPARSDVSSQRVCATADFTVVRGPGRRDSAPSRIMIARRSPCQGDRWWSSALPRVGVPTKEVLNAAALAIL